MDNFKVYIHTAPNGKKYVGVTSIDPEKRWLNGKGYPQKVFGSAIEQFGWENILHEIVADNLTEQEASEMEVFFIKKYNTTDEQFGYNVRKGGYNKREPKGNKTKMCLFLNLDLYDKVKEQAKKKKMSMTCYIVQAILNYIERG